MNENTPANPSVPPPITNPPQDPRRLPLGDNPEDRQPIDGFISVIESILRQPRRIMHQVRQQNPGMLILKLLLLAIACALIYGLVVGTFSLKDQLWAAPLKIALGLLLAGFICMPSLYIFSALSGSQARLVEIIGLLAGLLGLSTLLLIGFAPVAWIFSQSTQYVPAMGAMHLAFWFISTCFGLRFLHGGFRHLGLKSTAGLKVWMIIFVLVSLQMTTALRPLIGTSDKFLPALTEKKFFLQHWADCMKSPTSGSKTDEVEAKT